MSKKESVRERLKKEVEGEKYVKFRFWIKEKDREKLKQLLEKHKRYFLIEHGLKYSTGELILQGQISLDKNIEGKRLVVMEGKIEYKEEASLEPLLKELKRLGIEVDEKDPIIHIKNIVKEWKQLRKENEKLKAQLEKLKSKKTAWDMLESLLKLEFPKKMKDPLIASCIEEEEDFFIVLNRRWDQLPEEVQNWIKRMIFREIGAEWESGRIRIPKDPNEREQLVIKNIKELEEWKKKQKEKEIKKYAKPVTPSLYSQEELKRKLEKEMIKRELESDPLLRQVLFYDFDLSMDKVTVDDVITVRNLIEKEIKRIKEFLKKRGGKVHLKELARHFIRRYHERIIAELKDRGVIAIIDGYVHLLKG